jgi:ADP-L-glycero-D-manno-heptose 6-epimerase
VVHKAFGQITETGRVRLFKSCRPEYADGGQMRDFIYIKDCVEVLWWLLEHAEVNGIYNLGTGQARSWNDLIHAVFAAMKLETNIEYIDMPPGLDRQYQYFTEAKMEKLRSTGCPIAFHTLEDAIRDYVVHHMQQEDPFL